jgi:hypothetical protein
MNFDAALQAIDIGEALGIDPADAAPEHWRPQSSVRERKTSGIHTHKTPRLGSAPEHRSVEALLDRTTCRDNHSVLYQWIPKLFTEFALGRGDGCYALLPATVRDCQGRVLIGDYARHIHLTTSGQGMNTVISGHLESAMENLPWMLAACAWLDVTMRYLRPWSPAMKRPSGEWVARWSLVPVRRASHGSGPADRRIAIPIHNSGSPRAGAVGFTRTRLDWPAGSRWQRVGRRGVVFPLRLLEFLRGTELVLSSAAFRLSDAGALANVADFTH